MALGRRLVRISALWVVAAVPLLSLAAIFGGPAAEKDPARPKVGLTETLQQDMLVLDGPSDQAAPARAESIAEGKPVEILLRDWQYTHRIPSRFH